MMLPAVWTARETGASLLSDKSCGPRYNISGRIRVAGEGAARQTQRHDPAIPPDRADQSLAFRFATAIVPQSAGHESHRMKAAGKNVAVDGVSVTDDVTWSASHPKVSVS